ncbi:hypothetical protein C8R43DRAFT_965018 [Mycena crocata]|nr:hypothetical protein C8R43DRAFT_965018 [Mycena crocata]
MYMSCTTVPPPGKKHVKKAAYVIYRGINIGVRLTWSETKPLVSGVSNCIFHGYASVAEAQAAFSYAQVRSWMRVIGSARAAAIPIADLPQPLLENPLTWSETLDDTWYIVYAGILPGVYRSHLECQLNTLGISGALHESIIDQAAAFAKFAAAAGTVRYLPPTYYVDYSDPFLDNKSRYEHSSLICIQAALEAEFNCSKICGGPSLSAHQCPLGLRFRLRERPTKKLRDARKTT